jgi:serine/threonine protein kinase
MSPEQAAGRAAVFASDQFSFGVILFELLTGRRPFARNTSVETLSAIIRDDPPPIRTINPAVPDSLQRLVERCLAKQPQHRYADTRQIAVELDRIRAREVPPEDTRDRAALSMPLPPRVRLGPAAWRWPATGLALVAVAVNPEAGRFRSHAGGDLSLMRAGPSSYFPPPRRLPRTQSLRWLHSLFASSR